MKWVWNMELRGFYKLIGPLVWRMGEQQELSIWSGLKDVLEAPERTPQQSAVSETSHDPS
jgi:hypothetical protein